MIWLRLVLFRPCLRSIPRVRSKGRRLSWCCWWKCWSKSRLPALQWFWSINHLHSRWSGRPNQLCSQFACSSSMPGWKYAIDHRCSILLRSTNCLPGLTRSRLPGMTWNDKLLLRLEKILGFWLVWTLQFQIQLFVLYKIHFLQKI